MERDPHGTNGMACVMNTNPTRVVTDLRIDPALEAAVNEWTPREGPRPTVAMEPRPDGLRVKLTYLGVETGVLFALGSQVKPHSVQGTLDRVFDVLSWRVTSPPAATRTG
jgi:hypothetical protein